MKNFGSADDSAGPLRLTAYHKKMRREFGEHTWVKKSNANVEFVGDYIISKKAMKQPSSVKRPCEGEIRVRINKELRSLDIANKKLSKTREIHCQKRMVLQKDMNHVKELLVLLRSRHLAFEEFVKENQEKRERAQKNMQGRVTMRQSEIDALQKEITFWTKVRKLYDHLLRRHKLYEHFLNTVVATCPSEFKDCDALIRRYDAICEARDMCNKKHKQDIMNMEECLIHLQQKSLIYKMEILGLKNRVCTLSKQYGIAHNKSIQWENAVEKVKDAVLDGQQERTQIGAACWNLYQIMCHRQNSQVSVSETDMSEQMVAIKHSLLTGAKILSTVQADMPTKRDSI